MSNSVTGARGGAGPRAMRALGAVIGENQPHAAEFRKSGGGLPAGRPARPDPILKIRQTRFGKCHGARDGGKGRAWAGYCGSDHLAMH